MPTRSQARVPIPTELSLDLGNGSSLNVVFDRNAVTTDWARLLELAASQGDVMAAADGLAAVILSWDLVEDDGTPIAPTALELALLSMTTLDRLGDQLVEMASPGAAEGNASSTSSPAITAAVGSSGQDSQSFPNGSASSPSPTVSASPLPT